MAGPFFVITLRSIWSRAHDKRVCTQVNLLHLALKILFYRILVFNQWVGKGEVFGLKEISLSKTFTNFQTLACYTFDVIDLGKNVNKRK